MEGFRPFFGDLQGRNCQTSAVYPDLPIDALLGSAAFSSDWLVCCERPTLSGVRAKLNGCLSWHLPVAHVVATMPEEDQSWSAGIITSGSTCGVLRVVLYQRDIQKERDPPAARISYQHAGLGRGNCPSTGSHANGENALELALIEGREGWLAYPSGPSRVNVTKQKDGYNKYIERWMERRSGF